MAKGVKFPDIVRHENPAYPIVDSNDVRGLNIYAVNFSDVDLSEISEPRRTVGHILSCTNAMYQYVGDDTSDTEWNNKDNWRCVQTSTEGGFSYIKVVVSKEEVENEHGSDDSFIACAGTQGVYKYVSDATSYIEEYGELDNKILKTKEGGNTRYVDISLISNASEYFLLKSNNLSDVDNRQTAIDNLCKTDDAQPGQYLYFDGTHMVLKTLPDIMTIKGRVDTVEELYELTDVSVGDVYFVGDGEYVDDLEEYVCISTEGSSPEWERLGKKAPVIQSDWEENDETSPAHVLNRTHYVIQEEETETLLDNANISQECNSYTIGETTYSFTGFYNGYAPTAEDEGKLFRVSVTDYDGRVLCDNLEVRAQVMSVPQENDGTVEFVEQVCIPFYGDPTLTSPTGLAAGFSANSQLFFVSNLDEYDPYDKQDFIVTLIKVTQEEEVQKLDEKYLPENIQSDWNQSDSTQIDYVKNRTHWMEDGTIQEAKHIDETNYDSQQEIGSNLWNMYENIQLTEELIIGTTITFNGVDYQLTNENRSDAPILIGGQTKWFFGKHTLFGGDVDVLMAMISPESSSSSMQVSWFSDNITMADVTFSGKAIGIVTFGDNEQNYSWNLPAIGGIEYHKLDKEYVDTDWDENDEESVSHIKNRTHWREHIVQDQLTLNLENYDELNTNANVAIYKNIRLTENALIGSTITYHHIVGDALVTDTYTLTDENRVIDAEPGEEFWWYFGNGYYYLVFILGVSPAELEQAGVTKIFKSTTVYADSLDNEWGDRTAMSGGSYEPYSFLLKYRGEEELYQEFTLNAINEYTYHKLDENYLPENIQSDWDQNDDTQIDYIKNRTHYEYSENIYPGDDDISENGYFRISDSIDTLSGNKLQLRVLSSGSVVDCSAIYESFWRFNISDGELGAILYVDLENGNESNSYEYVTVRRSNVKYILNVKFTSTIDDVSFEPGLYVKDDDTYMFGVYLPQIKQLDEKYLPDNFVRREDLASVAFSGNYNDLQNRYRQQVHTTDTTQEMVANTFYIWDNPLTQNDMFSPEFSTDEDETIVNEYAGIFTTGDTVPILAMPGGIIWLGGLPTLLPNHVYEFSVINEYGVFSPQDYTTTEMVQTMIDNARLQWEDLD